MHVIFFAFAYLRLIFAKNVYLEAQLDLANRSTPGIARAIIWHIRRDSGNTC